MTVYANGRMTPEQALGKHLPSHLKKPSKFMLALYDALQLTFFEDVTALAPKPWLIKGVIARGETSSWIGPPGAGKSALLTDLTIHLGNGQTWRGYRIKERCAILYLAIERA